MKINKKIKVLSLFDGIACGRVALERAGFEVEKYYASEIDKFALQITRKNFPDIIQLGDVTKVNGEDFKDIDLLCGGSPCVGFSFAGKQLNFEDKQSKLFFEFVRILKEAKPKYFLLENVRMKQEYQDVISEHLGVKPLMINASLVSAQNRNRLFWTNIPNITQPKDKKIFLKDILEKEVDAKYYLSEKIQERFRLTKQPKGVLSIIGTTKPEFRTIGQRDVVYGTEGKMGTLIATDYKQPKQICDQIGEVDIKGFDCIKRVYSGEGKCPTLTSMQGGHRQPKILDAPVAIAQRGRNIVDGKRKDIKGAKTEQRLETSFSEKSNCLTSVQKDSLVLEATGAAFRNQITKRGLESQLNIRKDNKSNCVVPTYPNKLNCVSSNFRVRKLTPVECARLQTLPDSFVAKGINEKGEEIDISDSQQYKVLGNGWVVDVIAHIFKNIII